MFKDGMLVQAIRDTQYCNKDEIAEVEECTEDGEMLLNFCHGGIDNKISSVLPSVYFNFEDFVVLEQNAD